MLRELDIILFGATGYTGKNAIPYLSKLTKAKNRELKWGIAGRSKEKLQKVLTESESKLGTSLSSVPLIKADLGDGQSLAEMARRARIIINCAGPYRFYGEPVVKACVDEGTHYVDVSGEPQFMEKMALKYHKHAQEKGIYVISACGVDSIPTDLGAVFLQKKFNGTVNSIEAFGHVWQEGTSRASANYATWESAVYGLGSAKELKEIRSQLYKTRLPRPSLMPKLKFRPRPHKNKIVDGWIVPFLGADRSVMSRTQFLLHEIEKQRPAQVQTYLIIQSTLRLIIFLALGGVFSKLTQYESGRNLLLKYPGFFSFGVFSKDPPKAETVNNSWFTFTLYGLGWKEPLSANNAVPVDKAVCVRVKGRNPAYGSTNVCVVLAAITVLTETDKLPGNGGVFPPGYAFAETSLVEELTENEVIFEVLFEKELKLKAKL